MMVALPVLDRRGKSLIIARTSLRPTALLDVAGGQLIAAWLGQLFQMH